MKMSMLFKFSLDKKNQTWGRTTVWGGETQAYLPSKIGMKCFHNFKFFRCLLIDSTIYRYFEGNFGCSATSLSQNGVQRGLQAT